MEPIRLGVLTLALAACAAPPAPEVMPSPPHGNPCVRAGRACTDMYVVAHEDDDLLFMNPDLADSIAAGNHVVIVHVTAGDLPADRVADFTQYWVDRERGILNAFSMMALGPGAAFTSYQPPGAAPAGWTASIATYGGLAVAQYELAPSITAVFLRLSDFQLTNAWNDQPGTGGQLGGAMLPAGDTLTLDCVDPATCTLGTTIAGQQLTREQLIGVLASLITTFAADSVSAQDATTPPPTGESSGMFFDELGTPAYGSTDPLSGFTEYWDHVYSAAFTLVAATRAQAVMPQPLSLRLYRGYTISQEPPSLDDAAALAKAQVFARYAVFDTSIEEPGAAFDVEHPRFHGGDYELDTPGSWQHRELATRTLLGAGALQGRLAVAGNCVGIANGSVVILPCDGAPSWIVTPTNQLQLAGTASCLSVGDTTVVGLAPCAPQTAASTLFLFANGQLRSADAQCLGVEGFDVASEVCAHEPLAPHATGEVVGRQDFTLRFEAPRAIAGAPAGSELWLVRQHACARGGDAVTCAPWAVDQLGPPALLANLPAGATDVEARWDPAGGALVACARAGGEVTCGARTTGDHADDQIVRYADLAGQGAIDACGRGSAGVACSLDTSGAWAPAQLWSDGFSDANGWADPAYGATIQLADVDGDGLADACGRSAQGLECASQLAGAFAGLTPRGFDEDRTAGVAQDFADVAYESLRLVDVNHDGLADACMRGAAGVSCAMSTGTTFERAKLVAPGALDGALAWGDLDGDGRVDVCALGAAGLVCAAGY